MKCKECGKFIATERGMNLHMIRVHDKSKPIPQPPPKQEPVVIDTDAAVLDMSDDKGHVRILSRLETLKNQAEMEMDKLGHSFGRWKNHPGWSVMNCTTCGLEAAAAPHPMRGVRPVSGDAVSVSCSG